MTTMTSTTMYSVHPSLNSFTLDEVQANFKDGTWLMISIVVPTLLLEAWSYETARALYQKNKKLYLQAFALNFVNHFLLGTPAYAISVTLLARESTTSDSLLHLYLQTLLQVLCIVTCHSLLFYKVHQTFHTQKWLYKWHKFHHLFNTHVPPISANAVSLVEYLIGYLSPFAVAMIVFQCTATALWISIQWISICNLVMHTPKLEHYYDRIIPTWLVGTGMHLEHHSRLNKHFSAPTLDLDYIGKVVGGLLSTEKDTMDSIKGENGRRSSSSSRRSSGMEKGTAPVNVEGSTN
jgi:sterol desaturase/sphingolipid hydroxylase (fatty acid hydroxylase superfamily)